MKRMIALILTVLILSGSIALAQDNSQYSLETITKVPDFSTIDQNGNPVDQSVFANAEYTLLVFWGTWCGPCVEEIPKLAAAVEGLSAIDVQIVGICEDGKTDRETALNILETDNATYVNIMPDDQFYDDFVSLCFSFPSAMLIDSNGNVVQNQFSLENNANAIVQQVQNLLQAPGTASTVSPSTMQESSDPLVAYYDQYKQSLLDNGISETDVAVTNLPTLLEMTRKAYTYATDYYFLRIKMVTDGKDSGEILRFVTGGNYREEEYSNGKITFVTVYNAKKDEYTQYDVSAGNTANVSNASLKGYLVLSNLYASMDVFSNNAARGTLSDVDYQGKAAVLSEFDATDFVNKVWFDKETGIILEYDQNAYGTDYSETHILTPNITFDDSIFEFDASVLSVDTQGL